MTYANKLNTIIEEAKGIIRVVEKPKKRRLAYPVNKQKEAYFGWTTFSILPENLSLLEKRFKFQEWLLRHLITEEEIYEMSRPVLHIVPSRPAKPKTVVAPRREAESEKALDLEALDKKLEEILGK